MAGSYRHLLDSDGKFRFDLIENMGDAYEACEECFIYIQVLRAALRRIVDIEPPTEAATVQALWRCKQVAKNALRDAGQGASQPAKEGDNG